MHRKHIKKVKPFIEFNITQKCNYKCEYCSQWRLDKNKPEELYHASSEVIDGFISLLENLGKEYEINLIGGEPFCHPKFIETAKRISKLGNKVIVYTNMSFPVSMFRKLIDETNDNLLIHGALHVAQIKDLDKNISDIIEINSLLGKNSKLEIVSVLEEETFETLKYVENKLKNYNIDFIYIRLIKKNGEISTYSKNIEEYLKPREHKYNKDMINARKLDTKNVLCYAGYKLFHVLTDGTIVRCWSFQSNKNYQTFGNVKNLESVNLLKHAMPCYSPTCYCQHPTARNAYYKTCLTPLYHISYEKFFSVKNEHINNKKYKVINLLGIKAKFKIAETSTVEKSNSSNSSRNENRQKQHKDKIDE